MSTLDCRFFTETLRKFEDDPSIMVQSFSKNAACGSENNFVAEVSRVILKGRKNGGDHQWSLIVKEIPKDMPFNPELVFQNEMYAYNHIIPTLNECLEKPLPFPKCLHASETLIVIEDLAVQGFGNVDRLIGLTYEHMKSGIKILARLHSASIILRHKNPDKFKEISTKVVELVYTPQLSLIIETQEFALKHALEILRQRNGKEDKSMINILENLKGRTFYLLRDTILKKRDIPVINHGDCWFNNILVRDSEVKFIDFQLMRTTSVASDLSYFLFINMKPNERIAKETELLDIYLNELNFCLFKGQVGLKLTKKWLNDEMKEFKLFGYINGMWLLPLLTETLIPGTEYQSVDKLSTIHKERILDFTRDFCKSVLTEESLVESINSLNFTNNERKII